MSLDACIANTAAELGLDQRDVKEIAARIDAFREKRLAQGQLDRMDTDVRGFAKSEADKARIAGALKRKQAALNVILRDEWTQDLERLKAAGLSAHEAILAKLVGSYQGVAGARKSASARRIALEGDWLGGMTRELEAEAPGALQLLKRPREAKALLDDIVREWRELRDGGKPGRTGNKMAQGVAKVLAKYAEASRLEANRAGANIGRLDGWGGPQAHDEGKLLKAGREAWVEATLPLLDLERSFGEHVDADGARKILAEVWSNITLGRGRGVTGARKGERLGPANLARSLEKDRVLHFKDADAWLAYSDRFGRGNVFTGMIDHLHKMARAVANMQVMGPNPEVFLGSILETERSAVRDAGGSRAGQKALADLNADLGAAKGAIGRAFAEVMGDTLRPVNMTAAKIGSGIRAVQSMAKLGGALVSSITDLVTYAHAMRFQGKGIFEGYANAFDALLGGRPAGERKAIAQSLSVGFDSLLGDIHSRFTADDNLPGKMSWAMRQFFKLNGLEWWTDRLTNAFASMSSNWMARQSHLSWDGLSEAYRHVLSLHGITPERWEVVRQAVETVGDHAYIAPEKLRELDDAAFAGLIDQRGQAGGAPSVAMPSTAALKDIARKRSARETQHLSGSIDPLDTRAYADLEETLRTAPGQFKDIQAHGIAGRDPERQLADLLANGIDQARVWHTGALGDALDPTIRAAGLGAKVDAPYVLLAHPGKGMKADGIAAVLVNGAATAGLDDLRRAFPSVEFLTADQLASWKGRPAGAPLSDTRTQRLTEKARRDLELDLRSFFADEAGFGVLQTDDRTRMTSTWGLPPGSGPGEAIRFIMQFKSFPIAYTQKILAPTLRGRGPGGARDYGGLAALIGMSWVFGYAAMSMKDILKNRTPKDPARYETIMAALLQGGGAGIYGDFLFGSSDRFGGGPLEAAAGPTLGTASSALQVWQNIVHGDAKAGDAYYLALNNTPFLNLLMVRPALDLLVLNQISEWMSPGTLRRREQRLQKQFGQRNIVDPMPLR